MKRRVFFERLITFGAISGMSLISLFGVFPSFFSTRRTSTKLVLGTEEELFKQTSFITKHIDNRTFIMKKTAEGTIEAFDAACTHAGCPVQWNEIDQTFLCKCHGGIFDAQGLPLAGPPKKPLNKLTVKKRDITEELIIYLDNEQE
ncbi:MAG: Rieske (2Fe-2S) protein [Ignavibacteria bacterium]|nr:Rieske (2Fe-2S) protein [Ignavibacteria bacterium]